MSCLEFWTATNLITGGEDGQVCLWRCNDWEVLLKFRAHKLGIADLAVHPSGRLMATAGRDKTVRLWDLTRGTSAANVPVEEAFEYVQWSPEGGRLAALSLNALLTVDVAGSGDVATYRNPESTSLMRLTFSAMVFLTERSILLGDGKGDLRVVEIKTGHPESVMETCRLPADENRRRVKVLARSSSANIKENSITFAVGMSSGRVEVWRGTLPKEGSWSDTCFERLQVVETSVRLTSLAFWGGFAKQIKSAESAKGAAKSSRRPVKATGVAKAPAATGALMASLEPQQKKSRVIMTQ